MKMKQNKKKHLWMGIWFLLVFLLWTALIRSVDMQAAGPTGTKVGFAAINLWFHKLTGVHMTLYTITDWLGLVPIAVCLGFGVVGVFQLIRRKSLIRVDPDILLLGLYYVLVILAYLIFEMIPINYRPILINGALEASYPATGWITFGSGFFPFFIVGHLVKSPISCRLSLQALPNHPHLAWGFRMTKNPVLTKPGFLSRAEG